MNVPENKDYYPANGQVNLQMYLYGRPIKVMIDDKIPYGVASKGPDGAWWGVLAEKAVAKYLGQYWRINKGGWM
jgi:hypothetical protein